MENIWLYLPTDRADFASPSCSILLYSYVACPLFMSRYPLYKEHNPHPLSRLSGRSLAAFAATPLLLLSTFARNASAVYDVPDLIKLAELREYVQQPRFHGVDDPADLFPEWYIAW